MLESLIDFKTINEKPYMTFIWAIIISSVAIIITSQISSTVYISNTAVQISGLFALTFTLLPSVYFVTLLIKKEELIEENALRAHYAKGFWERHEKDILILLFYFLGLTLSFAVWTMILPQDFFQIQTAEINRIHGLTGAAAQFSNFTRILTNNMQVMFFALIFSFIFGAGAVFIIVWNASILGVYIGQLSKSIWHIPVVSFSFLPHGIPEIGGYVAAGLAGGLLSAAIIRKADIKILKGVAFDSMKIFILGAILIVIGAAIEVL